MESNGNEIQVAARRFWNIVRGMILVLRKNICNKKKLTMFDFDIMFKRGKLAGKNIIHNLAFHSQSKAGARYHFPSQLGPHHEYEFSCSNTPARVFPFPFRNKNNNNNHFFACAHAPETADDIPCSSGSFTFSSSELLESPAVAAFLKSPMFYNANSSPALPGFGRTPISRQLRVTDSPYPVHDLEESCHVDKAAEEFILKFYEHLRKQDSMARKK
ncbi:uncharacterized protein LOC124944951 [Impatiens glandulifera]|uniref:uncharacterized protein LOC124944951 n=1 Tax=Impatiens glandulifera TaxID=253017 RepID=UPI001FB131C6|nr:uncharacterized protein LOC124944951 [Impatiens glandulifera]